MKVTLRPRWSVLVIPSIGIAAIYSTPGLLRHDGIWWPLCYGIGLGFAPSLGTRRRRVTVSDEGLRIYRGPTFLLFCAWEEIVGVERRQLGPLATDQLVLREPVRRWMRSHPNDPPEAIWRPAPNHRVLIGLYDKHWRDGPIGEALTARGISLVATPVNASGNQQEQPDAT